MNAAEFHENEVFQSLSAENSLIGGLLLNNSAFDRVNDRLKPEYFYSTTNRLIFKEIVRQLSAGKQCDVVTVAMALGEESSLQEINNLAQHSPSIGSMKRYADIVIERYKSRQLAEISSEIVDLATSHHLSIDERVESAQAQLGKLMDDAPKDEWVSAYEGMINHIEVLENRAEGLIQSMSTGLEDLDNFLEGGLRPGSLVIVGARPSMGKTALAMTIAVSMAERHAVAMLSMEMPHSELRDRLTAMLGNVSLQSVIRPSRGDGLQWDRVVEGAERAKRLNFNVSDQGGLNINQVRSKARNLKRVHGLDVLVIDYIGLMNGLDAKQARAYQLEEISRGLKTLAKELSIAIVCLAQVNRKVEERVDATPALSDLRDSGAIEQDADIVIFVHRPIQAKPDLGDEWKYYAKVSVAKNRQGRCGYLNLSYMGEQTRFSGWAGNPPSNGSFGKVRKEL